MGNDRKSAGEIIMQIIGIDPGFTGAIASIDTEKDFVVIHDLPVKKIRTKKQIDEVEFTNLVKLIKYTSTQIKYAVIEDVWTMPGQGIASSGRFMYNAGILLGVLAALDIKILKTPPSVWKPALGLSRDKKDSLALAKKLFPKYKHYFKRVKDDGRAEAALIAHFARISL